MAFKIYHITMFGGLHVAQEGSEWVEFPPQQSSALLAYLALHPQKRHTREELIEQLFPGEGLQKAQQKIRRCLLLLRQRFEQPPFGKAEILLSTRLTVSLDPNLVSTDVQEFKDALAAAAAAIDLSERQRFLAQAVALYRGDLLPGFYQGSFLSERNRLSDLYVSALHLLTQVYEQAGDLERAVESARRTVALDPLMEEGHCTLMRLFAEMGQPSAVLKQYQVLERVLREAFGEEPPLTTRKLMEMLRERAQANVPHTVNGKPPLAMPTIEEEAEPVPSKARPMPAPLPARSLSIPALWPRFLLGAGLVVLLVMLGSVFLHRKMAPPKPALFVPDAKTIWVARYPPASDEKDNSEPTAMTTDAAGNIYITGFVQTLHNDVDFLTLKYDPNGKLLWRRRYNGPGNDVDRARSITVDKDGNIYVTGESDNGKGNGTTRLAGLDWATIKYGPDGMPSPTWPDVGFGVGVRRYNGAEDGEDRPVKICVDREGNVYVTGNSRAKLRHNEATLTPWQWVTVRYDPKGQQIWTHREPAAKDWLQTYAADMVVDPLNNVYVTGWVGTDRLSEDKTDLLIIKYASNGDCLWRKTYNGKGYGNVASHRIALDGAGNVYVTGEQYDGDLMNNGTLKDIVTLKYDADGNKKWCHVYDNNHRDEVPQTLAVDSAGNVYITGNSEVGPGDSEYLTLKYGTSGDLQWARTYRGRDIGANDSLGIAVDKIGNALVTGTAWNGSTGSHTGTDYDYVTIKYDPVGRALWKGVYDGNGQGDRGYLIAVDSTNAVIVSGQSDLGNNTPSITTVKYAPDASAP